MKLAWSKSDEPKHPQARDIKRNCGQLLGRTDELLPCLYIRPVNLAICNTMS
jgi:hypothetical protein